MAKALGEQTLVAVKADTRETGIAFCFELGIGLAIISYARFFLGVTVGYNAVYFKAAALLCLLICSNNGTRVYQVCTAALPRKGVNAL